MFNTSMTATRKAHRSVVRGRSYHDGAQIGNYGVAGTDQESEKPQVAGFVMRESVSGIEQLARASTLKDYLTRHNIIAIGDIDTRALPRSCAPSA